MQALLVAYCNSTCSSKARSSSSSVTGVKFKSKNWSKSNNNYFRIVMLHQGQQGVH